MEISRLRAGGTKTKTQHTKRIPHMALNLISAEIRGGHLEQQ